MEYNFDIIYWTQKRLRSPNFLKDLLMEKDSGENEEKDCRIAQGRKKYSYHSRIVEGC